MSHTFSELVIGGVMIAPFVTYLVASIVAFALLRPLFAAIGFDNFFSNPPLAQVSLFIIILALVMMLL